MVTLLFETQSLLEECFNYCKYIQRVLNAIKVTHVRYILMLCRATRYPVVYK